MNFEKDLRKKTQEHHKNVLKMSKEYTNINSPKAQKASLIGKNTGLALSFTGLFGFLFSKNKSFVWVAILGIISFISNTLILSTIKKRKK